jgi:hypothetical protein
MRYGGYPWVSTQPAVNVLYSVRLGAGPEVGPLLFLGMNEHKMHDLVETFREVAGLRIDRL